MALAERESELPHTARSGASVVVADPSDMLGHVRGPAYAKGVIEALLRGDSGGGGDDAPMARSVGQSFCLNSYSLFEFVLCFGHLRLFGVFLSFAN